MTTELFINAIVAGLLLGGLYAALTVGVSLSFGMLDIVNIAHPAFIILGAYIAYILNLSFGLDPLLASIVLFPFFWIMGALVYQIYYVSFESRGQDPMRGLAFFFGIMIIVEVLIIIIFGVDFRYVEASYLRTVWNIGFVALPLRMLVPFVVAIALVIGLIIYLSRTFTGRLVLAVSQDSMALKLLAADPVKVKRRAFALSVATASIAGALLIMVQPVEPSIGREYIGRVFAICVLGGLRSLTGMLIGAVLIGVVESIASTFYGPSWTPAVAFGLLLFALAFKPAGLLGR